MLHERPLEQTDVVRGTRAPRGRGGLVCDDVRGVTWRPGAPAAEAAGASLCSLEGEVLPTS